MAEPLTGLFGVPEGVVSFVGAGGKTTLTFGLARDLLAEDKTVIVTTTTKMGSDQDGGFEMIGPDPAGVRRALAEHRSCLVVGSIEGHKANGVSPEWVDDAAAGGWADAVIVEADGARRRKVKAPAHYEPVIPASSTLVVAVMSMAAVGGTIGDVAHRPEILADLLDTTIDERLTEDHAAALLGSDDGAQKSVPRGARFVVALTDASGAREEAARRIAGLISPIPTVVFAPFSGEGRPEGVRA